MTPLLARPGLRRSAVLAIAALVAALLGVLPTTGEAPARAATTADCVAVGDTPLPASCQVSLEPTRLPQRKVIGEYELGVLTRDGAAESSLGELSAGGLDGSCDPSTEICSLSNRVDLSDPREPTGQTTTVPDDSFGATTGDSAGVAVDVDGDGRQELVRAARCAGSENLCLSYLTPGAAPGNPSYLPGTNAEIDTDLPVDTTGVGRIELAAGAVGLSSATVTGATFAVDDAGETTTATFTTAQRHQFQVGDPVRLGNDPTMQASLCVDSALSKDGFQCIGGDLLSYHPITAVTARTFSVDLGVLVTARRGVGEAVTPAPWQAGCPTCGVTAEAISPGVVVAWTAPTMSLHVATFAVRSGDHPFRLLDARPVGRLYSPPANPAAPQREAVGLAVDDFASGGPAEIAVAWGGECAQADPTAIHVPCGKLTFLGMDDAQRLTQLSTNTWGDDPWCSGGGGADASAHRGPFALSMASGHFRSSGSTSPGADIALAWVASEGAPPSGETGQVSHVLQTFDVTPQLGLAPTMPLQVSDTSDDAPCATVLSRHASVSDSPASGGPYPLRSNVRVAAADLDGNTGDEVVVAETMPQLQGGIVQSLDLSPVSLSVWNQETADGAADGWRPVSRRQPDVPGWTQPFSAPVGGTTPVPVDAGYLAAGEGGSGQISLAVGRLARRQSSSTDSLAYPNGINPDVVLGWTCQSDETCGTSAAGDSVATDALAATSDGLGGMTLERQSGTTLSARPADVPRDLNLSPAVLDRSYVQVVTTDFNGDSSTLGDPLRSYAVGEVRPLMILRAPPVEFAAIDGSHPGYPQDNRLSSAEVYDLSGCYAANGANTDTGECDMRTTYATEGQTEQSFSVSVGNSWGIDAAFKNGLSGGAHDALNGLCTGTCWEASVEVAYSHSEEQQTEQERAKTFSYTTEQTVAPMQDRAFVATSDVEITQVPVYYGTFTAGELPAEPDLWTYSATPRDTVFSWISTTDPQYGSVFAGPMPGNVLSYPEAESQVPTLRTRIVSIRREGPSQVAVSTAGNHGFVCALQGEQVTASFPSSVGAQCAGQFEPVRVRGAGVFDGTDYVVAAVRTPTQVVLQKTSSSVPVAPDPCGSGSCTLSKLPSALPVQTQEIGPGTSGSVSFTFGQVEGYSERYAVSNAASIEVATEGETEIVTDLSYTWEAHVKGEFEHNDESMMNMVLESATTWAFDYGSAGRPGSYRITPYLATDPGTGALTLTWTTAPVGSSGLWGNPVFGYGAVGDPDLPPRPDASFSLPLLYEPYRVHTGLDDNLDVILSSPDFKTWDCDEQKVCRPLPAVDPGGTLTVPTRVHNYALTDLNASPSRPLVVRYYLGDPARGGYVIDEQEITEPIPPRGDTQVTAHWTPPAGFAGQPGQPVYAVLDPGGLFDEVFDQAQPLHLWDRSLRGKLATASTQVVDGTPVYVFRTEVDHGLLVGNRVKIAGMGPYDSKGRVLSTTATTFTLPAKGSPAPLQQRGRWFSAQNDSCMTNNPWYGNAIKDFYSFGTEGSKEFQSTCPTSNNEGYFLTPRVTGNRGAVTRTNLSIAPSSVKIARDGRGVVAQVASSSDVVDADVMVRAWVCATPTEVCSPSTADPSKGYEVLRTLTIPAGGTAKVTVPVKGSLGRGQYRVAFQVVPLSVWERPAGPGVVGKAMGEYDDNAAVRLVTRK